MGLNLGEGRATPATTTKEELAKRAERPTHEDVGKLAERPDTVAKSAVTPQPLAEATVSADDGVVRYSSHPILKYKIGRFKFENGLLELREKKDVEDFEATLKKLPRSESIRLKKLDLSAAEALVRATREAGPKATKGIGSEIGDRDSNNKRGTGRLEDLNA